MVLENNTHVLSATSTNATICLWVGDVQVYIYVYACAHVHTEARERHGMSDSINFYLIPLSWGGLSMNLALGWWPVSPSNPPVSLFPHSYRLRVHTITLSSLHRCGDSNSVPCLCTQCSHPLSPLPGPYGNIYIN